MDPLLLLDVDDIGWLIRFACAKVIENDRKEQAKETERRKG